MKLSVVIPSRLQENPASQYRNLWLSRALESIGWQDVGVDTEIVVGLDEGAPDPSRVAGFKFAVARSAGHSQAEAVNAAVHASTGDVLAILEDDDYWEPHRVRYGLAALEAYELTTSSQREIDEGGSFVRYNDFPTPSGWMMPRTKWHPMDPAFRWHLDNAWLGGFEGKRIHLVDEGADINDPNRAWLRNIPQPIGKVNSHLPLVVRTVNRGGGMATLARDPEAAKQSQAEYMVLVSKFGRVPW